MQLFSSCVLSSGKRDRMKQLYLYTAGTLKASVNKSLPCFFSLFLPHSPGSHHRRLKLHTPGKGGGDGESSHDSFLCQAPRAK